MNNIFQIASCPAALQLQLTAEYRDTWKLNRAGVANSKEVIKILSAKNTNIDILTEKKTIIPANRTVTVAGRLRKGAKS